MSRLLVGHLRRVQCCGIEAIHAGLQLAILKWCALVVVQGTLLLCTGGGVRLQDVRCGDHLQEPHAVGGVQCSQCPVATAGNDHMYLPFVHHTNSMRGPEFLKQ